MRSGASAACGWRPTTRSGTSFATSSTRFARTASPPSGATSCPSRSPVASPARSSTRRCGAPACTARAAARSGAAEAGVEIREHRRVGDPGRARGGDGRRGDRRLSERAPGRARGADHPHARPDDRDRAGAGAAVPDAALRPARLRLLAAGRRRADPRGRLPRLRSRVRVHRPRRRRRRGSRTRSRTSSSMLGRPARAYPPLGRRLRAGARPDARRRAGARATTASGSPAATRGTATCSAWCAATSSRRRSSASRIRCSSGWIRRGSSPRSASIRAHGEMRVQNIWPALAFNVLRAPLFVQRASERAVSMPTADLTSAQL